MNKLPAEGAPLANIEHYRRGRLVGLVPIERRLAEAYVVAEARNGHQLRRDSKILAEFLADFNKEYRTNYTPRAFAQLRHLASFREYCHVLRQHPAQGALAQLDAAASDAVATYRRARELAQEAGDYKAMHITSADHLDRIGATRRKEQPVVAQAVQIVLKSRNFEPGNLLAAGPEIEVVDDNPE